MPIPPGFNTVTPHCFVAGADGFLEFLVQGLGGTEILRYVDGDRIANAQVRLGTSKVMVSEAFAAYPAMPASYYLTRAAFPKLEEQQITCIDTHPWWHCWHGRRLPVRP